MDEAHGTATDRALDTELRRIIEARHHDPAAVLGYHPDGEEEVVRSFLPHAREVRLNDDGPRLTRRAGTDVFEWRGPHGTVRRPYVISWVDEGGEPHRQHDPYAFPPQLSEFDLHLFGEGRHLHIYRHLGAHLREVDGVPGVLFATWAPNAERVSVVGDFNRWDGRVHPMRARGGTGVWELFIPGLSEGALYKFELRNRHSGAVLAQIRSLRAAL